MNNGSRINRRKLAHLNDTECLELSRTSLGTRTLREPSSVNLWASQRTQFDRLLPKGSLTRVIKKIVEILR